MATEKEAQYLPPEEKFDQLITDKKALWLSLINESDLEASQKQSFRLIIEEFAKPESYKKYQDGIDGAFYGTVSGLLNAREQTNGSNEANSLFENLKADLWDFFNLIKK